MSELRQRIDRLSADQRQLIAQWISQQSSARQEDDGGRKRLVAYVVPTSDDSELPSSADLKGHIASRLPDYMVPDVIVPLRALPRRPNGKLDVQRLPLPQQSLPDTGDAYVAPRNDVEETLTAIWSELMGVERISIHDNFFEVGGDSIISIQVISRAREVGIWIEAKQIVSHPTIACLASVALTENQDRDDEALIVGDVPLTPIQHWFFELGLRAPQHWNQAACFEVPVGVNVQALKDSLSHCIQRHDALRASFHRTGTTWRQELACPKDVTVPFTITNVAGMPDEEEQDVIARMIESVQSSFDLDVAPLVRAAFFHRGEGQVHRLFITAHHLVIDVLSWNILLQDLERFYDQLVSGTSIDLPATSTSFGRWTSTLNRVANDERWRRDAETWLRFPNDDQVAIPTDFSGKADPTEANAETIEISLDLDQTTALLHEVHGAYNTRVNDLLVSALVSTLGEWMERREVYLGFEGHGRQSIADDVDVSNTVGWFTSYYPSTISTPESSALGDLLKSVKEQLRTMPNGGIGFGIGRYLRNDKRTKWRALPKPEILFNYVGNTVDLSARSLLKQIDDTEIATRDGRNRRTHLIEINAAVRAGVLRADWTYVPSVHRPETIERLVTSFRSTLVSLIEHCRSPATGGFTPSDFPDAELDQDELDRFLDTLDEGAS